MVKIFLTFLALIVDKDGNLNLNFEDDLVKGTCITYAGKVVNERINQLLDNGESISWWQLTVDG